MKAGPVNANAPSQTARTAPRRVALPSFTADWVAIASLIVLTILIGIVGLRVRVIDDAWLRGSVYSTQPDGTQAVRRWIDGLGYTTVDLADLFALTDTEDALFVIAPTAPFTPEEILTLDSWVTAGGTLIIAQAEAEPAGLLNYYGLAIDSLWFWQRVERETLTLPTFSWPSAGEISVQTRAQIAGACGRAAVHLGNCETPLLIALGHGAGQVIVLSAVHPLTNAGFQQGDNTHLIRNLLNSAVPPNARIAFDEAHHRPDAFAFSAGRLVDTTEGAGILYLLGLLVVYALWRRGRPFGGHPPETHQPPTPLRSQASVFIGEMVAMQGNDLQQSTIQQYYWQRLKRQLGRKYGLDPSLPDDLFFGRLNEYAGEVDMPSIIALGGVRHEKMTARRILWWVQRIIELIEREAPPPYRLKRRR